MESIFGEQDQYLKKCGELFLTTKGNIAFHCTLCEERFKSFQFYNDHLLETHYALDFMEEELEFRNEDEETLDPLNEETFSYDSKDKSDVKKESEEDSYDSPAISNQLDEQIYEEVVIQKNVENPHTIHDVKHVENRIRSKIRSINVKETIKDRKYKCPYCDFTGADYSNMRGHIKRHSMNKPHKCSKCEKAFYTRTELKTHVRTHTGERPFLCNICGKSFVTSGTLGNHQKLHKNIRDIKCTLCKMAFFNTKSLRKHMTVHSDKRDFKCTKCDSSFKLIESLRNHMKLHENKRQYHCKLCYSKFNQYAGLYSHMKNCHSTVLKSSKEN